MSGELNFTTAAFGGFEKREVIDHINSLEQEHDLQQGRLEKKISQLETHLKEYEQSLAKSLDTKSNSDLLLKRTVQELETERNTKNTLLTSQYELEQKIRNLEALLEQQKATPPPIVEDDKFVKLMEEKEFLEKEKEKISESTAQIGQVMLDASIKASEMLRTTELQAGDIIRSAEHSVAERLEQLDRELDQKRQDETQSLKNQIVSVKSELNQKMDHANQYIETVIKEITGSGKEVVNTFRDYNSIVEQINLLNKSSFSAIANLREQLNQNIDAFIDVDDMTFILTQKEEHSSSTAPSFPKEDSFLPETTQEVVTDSSVSEEILAPPLLSEEIVSKAPIPEAAISAESTVTDELLPSDELGIPSETGSILNKPSSLSDSTESDSPCAVSTDVSAETSLLPEEPLNEEPDAEEVEETIEEISNEEASPTNLLLEIVLNEEESVFSSKIDQSAEELAPSVETAISL